MAAVYQLLQPAARELGRQRHHGLVQAQAMLGGRQPGLAGLDLGLVDRIDAGLGLISGGGVEQAAGVGGRVDRERSDLGCGH